MAIIQLSLLPYLKIYILKSAGFLSWKILLGFAKPKS